MKKRTQQRPPTFAERIAWQTKLKNDVVRAAVRWANPLDDGRCWADEGFCRCKHCNLARAVAKLKEGGSK